MPRRVEMLGGVSVRRVIATANMTAGPTEPQVHPDGTRLEALLATAGARRYLADLIICEQLAGRIPVLVENSSRDRSVTQLVLFREPSDAARRYERWCRTYLEHVIGITDGIR